MAVFDGGCSIAMYHLMGRMITKGFWSNPILVVGAGRSGTMALLKALGEHPAIQSSSGEGPFVSDIGRMASELAYATNETKQYYDHTCRISREYIFESLRRLAFESVFGPHYGIRFLAKTCLRTKHFLFAKRYWCTKSFPGEPAARGILALYPGARFICILRNGMHVVHSRTQFPGFRDKEFGDHCRTWSRGIQRISYMLRLSEASIVRHEDFVEDADEVFRRVFEFLCLPYSSEPADYARGTHVHPLADVGISTGVPVKDTLQQREPPYEQWDAQQRAIFKGLCGDAMRLVGYEIPF